MGFMISGGGGEVNPAQSSAVLGSLDVSAVFPVFTMTDLTPSAKSLKIKVEGDLAYLQEKSALDGSLLTLDLANNKVLIDFALVMSPLTATRMLALGVDNSVVTIPTMTWDNLGLYMVAPTAADASQAGNPFQITASNATAGKRWINKCLQ